MDNGQWTMDNEMPPPGAAAQAGMSASLAAPDNSHYTAGGIEPWEVIRRGGLDFFEGNVVKYVLRWRRKGGVEDLRKARVYLDAMIGEASGSASGCAGMSPAEAVSHRLRRGVGAENLPTEEA